MGLSVGADNDGNRPIPNSYWLIPGRLVAGEYPGAIESRDAARKLRALLGAGINHFIDLTEHRELVAYREIAEKEARALVLNIGWERYPIADLSVPRRPEYMVEILNAIDSALGAGKTVYIHCWGGVGRTGTVVGCWLVRHGRTGDEVFDRIAQWWHGMEKRHRSPHSPETPEQ